MDLRRDSFANEQTFSQGLRKSCAKSEALCQKPTHHHNRTIAADPDVDRTYLVAGIPADRDPALVYLAKKVRLLLAIEAKIAGKVIPIEEVRFEVFSAPDKNPQG